MQCPIFMLIPLQQAGSPHHMAPHQNSFVSKVGSVSTLHFIFPPSLIWQFKGWKNFTSDLPRKYDLKKFWEEWFIYQTHIIWTKNHTVLILSSSTNRRKKFLIFVISPLLWSFSSPWRKETKRFLDQCQALGPGTDPGQKPKTMR